MQTWIRLVIRRRKLFAGALLLSVLLAAFCARTIWLRFQFSDFYRHPSNLALPLFERDIQDFGDPAGNVIAMVEADDVFAPEVLAYIDRVTKGLAPESVFSRVRSLTSETAVRAAGDEVISGPLLPRLDITPEELAAVKDFALHSSLLRRRLVSTDAKVTAVLATMRKPATVATIEEQSEAIDAMKRVLQQHSVPKGVQVRLTGAPSVEVETTRALMLDQYRLVPAVTLLLVIMLYVAFRSLLAVVLALAAVSTATIWTAGLFALFGRPIDLIGAIIPVTLLVYAVVDPIFVLARVLQKLDAGRAKNDAIVEAFVELALPCFLTSVSTALGFAAFLTSAVPSLRHFGGTVAIGVFLAWVTTVTVLPVLLAFAEPPRRRVDSSGLIRAVDRALCASWALLRGRAVPSVVLIVVALIVGAQYASHQTLSNGYVESLPAGAAHDDVRHLEKHLTGVMRLNVYLEGAPDALKDPAVLQAIEKLDKAIEKEEPFATFTGSLADLVAEAHQAFSGGEREAHVVPSSRALVAQYLSLSDPQARAELVSEDYSRSHIAVLLEDHGSDGSRRAAANVQRLVDQASFGALGIKASLTGVSIVGYPELDRIVIEVLQSFIIAFVIIVLLQWLLFRSLRIALISIIPNLLPLVACFCTTRLLGINIRIDTTLVLCVSLGGLFNTTIHYAARVVQRIEAGDRDPDEILLHAMRAVGPSSLFTAAALSAGFAVFMLSSFYGLRAMGLLSMVTLIAGFFSDMLATGVIMRLAFKWKEPERAPAPPALASNQMT